MQISKNFLAVFTMALLAGTANLISAESEAQARAREALRQKMSELDAQEKGKSAPARPKPVPAAPAPKTPAPVTPEPATPAPAASTPTPSAVAAPEPTIPAPAPARVDDEATTRAREAMRLKLRELDSGQPSASVPAAAAPPRKAPVAQPPPPVAPVPVPEQTSPAQPTYAAPVAEPTDTEASARARAALRQKMAELDGQQPSQATTGAAARPVASARPEFNPIAPPPSPLSGPKDARLAELLRQYRADQITPEQYHKERVKILAEP